MNARKSIVKRSAAKPVAKSTAKSALSNRTTQTTRVAFKLATGTKTVSQLTRQSKSGMIKRVKGDVAVQAAIQAGIITADGKLTRFYR